MLHAAGRVDEAEPVVQEAARLNPANADTVGNLGNICRERGHSMRLLNCSAKYGTSAGYWQLLVGDAGWCMRRKGDLGRGGECYRAALKSTRRGSTRRATWATRCDGSIELDEAESFARRALATPAGRPGCAEHPGMRPASNSGAGRSGDRLPEGTIDSNDDAPAQITLGNILNARQCWAEAEACFRGAAAAAEICKRAVQPVDAQDVERRLRGRARAVREPIRSTREDFGVTPEFGSC